MSAVARGLRAWLLQRITAVYLLMFFPYLVAHFAVDAPQDYVAWRAWIGDTLVGVGFAAFVVSLLAHTWVGVRDVVLDYVKPLSARVTVLVLIAFGLLFCGFWSIRALVLAAMAVS